jgi:hypothetical protein
MMRSLLLLLALLALPAHAVTIAGTPTESPATGATANVNSGSTILTFNHPGGSRTAVYVFIGWYDAGNANITAVTYGGAAMTEVAGEGSINANVGRLEIWRLVAPSTGAQNIVITSAAQLDFVFAMASGWTDVNQASPEGELPNDVFNAMAGTADLAATLDASDVLIGGTYTYHGSLMYTIALSDTELTNDATVTQFDGKASQASTDGSMAFTFAQVVGAIAIGAEINHDGGGGGGSSNAPRMHYYRQQAGQ